MKYIATNRNVSHVFVTSDCKVKEASAGMEWAINKDIAVIIKWCNDHFLNTSVVVDGVKYPIPSSF